MTDDVFVTGMIRSGTSLVQALLTNHPDMTVIYQPFHQLYVSTKSRFLRESGIERLLPMGDEHDADPAEAEAFRSWLRTRRFDQQEADEIAVEAVQGKGGSVPDLAGLLEAPTGTFHEIRRSLLDQLMARFGGAGTAATGSKEVLCEEYVPILAAEGSRVLVVVRDPRAVVSSADKGSYLAMVGDRYPVLMLIRLWRKSARAALAARESPQGTYLRYEDVATDPAAFLDPVATSLGLDPFPGGLSERPLLDHRGEVWSGNSSFGEKSGVDTSSTMAWRDLLDPQVADFIEACCLPELQSLGYPTNMTGDRARRAIEGFTEDETGVRPSYLALYRLDDERRAQESARSELQAI
ncbi:MAG: sulfotransferase [Nocardioides sp.]|uniref:sulfotransferase n=1 Tax=Nocardioides sp. TaxID=35761 RepID=UPI003D6BBF96